MVVTVILDKEIAEELSTNVVGCKPSLCKFCFIYTQIQVNYLLQLLIQAVLLTII